MDSLSEVAEGVATAPAASKLADKYGINAPIIKTVEKLLTGAFTPQEAVTFLMTTAVTFETHYTLIASPHSARIASPSTQ